MNLITGNEQKSDDPELNTVIEFYKAFNTGDMTSTMNNWAETEDIVMSNPLGGIKKGRDEIGSVYNNIFNGPAEVYVEFYDFTLMRSNQMFAIVGFERGQFKTVDVTIDLAIRTSRIYKNLNGVWKQCHHHGSIDNPELLKQYQTAVLGSK